MPLYVARFAQTRQDFRLAELQSVLDMMHADSAEMIVDHCIHSPFCILALPTDQDAKSLLQRTVLLMDCHRLIATASSLPALHELVRTQDWSACENAPFRFRIDSFMKTFTGQQQLDLIDSFSYMPLKGPVRLADPTALTFTLMHDHPRMQWTLAMKGGSEQATVTMRALVDRYSLKKREYLGTTSMDAELSLVMANVARVRPGSLVYDPFVGTGSLLMAASHFGALTVGSDIDGRQIRGGGGCPAASLHSNIAQYGLERCVLGGLVFDVTRHPWRDGVRFDAIIADPPYGVRAGAKRIAPHPSTSPRHLPLHLRHVHYPQTAPYELDDLTRDLLAFARDRLAVHGRLVFWYPQDAKGRLFDPSGSFQLDGLKCVYCIPQRMRMICRWLMVYERIE